MPSQPRSRAVQWVLGASAPFLFVSCGFSEPLPNQPQPPVVVAKGDQTHSFMQLTILPKRAEVVAGESLVVQVTLANTSAAPVEVPSPSASSEFEFLLRATAGDRAIRALSASAARLARSGDPVPPPPRMLVTVPPGERSVYEENLADYTKTALPVGQYRLSVVHTSGAIRTESPPVPLTVVAPRIRALATVVGPSEQRLGLVFAHSEAAEGVAIFQRESVPGHPGDGVAFRRTEIQRPASVSGVAVAAELGLGRDANQGTRWFAWLEPEALGAGVSQGATLFKRIDPVRLGLRSPVVHSVGWQPDVNSALFVALGYNAENQVALAAVNFSARTGGSSQCVPLSFLKLPARWAAQYQAGEAAGSVTVVVVEESTGVTRLHRQRLKFGADSAEAATLIYESPQLLAAFAMNPLGGEVVDALYGPAGKEGQMTFMRLPLAGGAPVAEWRFNAPVDSEQTRPTAWAIASVTQPDPVIAVKLRDRLLVRRTSGSEWSTLATGVSQASYLRIEIVLGRPLVVWFDPATGVQYRFVR